MPKSKTRNFHHFQISRLYRRNLHAKSKTRNFHHFQIFQLHRRTSHRAHFRFSAPLAFGLQSATRWTVVIVGRETRKFDSTPAHGAVGAQSPRAPKLACVPGPGLAAVARGPLAPKLAWPMERTPRKKIGRRSFVEAKRKTRNAKKWRR